jgi:hypothetical protein
MNWTPTTIDPQGHDTYTGIPNLQEVLNLHGVYTAEYTDGGAKSNITSLLMSYRLFLIMKTNTPNDCYCSARFELDNVHIYALNGKGDNSNIHATVTCDYARQNVPVANNE